MSYQRFAVAGVLAIIVAGGAAMEISAQAQSGPGGTSSAASLRTQWGDPDLQGVWTSEEAVPFERPAKYAGREFLTDEEIAALDKERAARAADRTPRGRDVKLEGEKDVAQAYNQFWSDGGRVMRTGRRTSQVIDPPDGQMPPLTPQAKARNAAERDYLNALLQGTSGGRPGPPSPRRNEPPPTYNLHRMNRSDGPEDRSTGERCMGSTLPAGGGFFSIVQSPDVAAIKYDIGQGSGFARVIPVTNAPHLPQHIRQYHGDARARWEGDTLVVELRNFTIKTDFQGSRENLRVIERFTRVDAKTLQQRVTVEDPTTWTRPWTFETTFTKQPERTILYESNCHEGNYGLVGMLANQRAAEKLFKEGKGKDPATMDVATGGGGSALPPGVGVNAVPPSER